MAKVKHTMLVATELTTEDVLELFMELARKLTYERDRAAGEARDRQSQFEMYRTAWLREMGGKLIHKSFDIDALVLTTQFHYANSQRWQAFQHRIASRDPFWMVNEPNNEPSDGGAA